MASLLLLLWVNIIIFLIIAFLSAFFPTHFAHLIMIIITIILLCVCFDVREKRNARQRLARVLSCNNAMNYKVSKNVQTTQTTIFRTSYYQKYKLCLQSSSPLHTWLGLIWSRYNGFHMQGQCQAEWKKIMWWCDDFLVGCLKENKRTRRKYKAYFYLQASFRNAMTVVIVIIINELLKCIYAFLSGIGISNVHL